MKTPKLLKPWYPILYLLLYLRFSVINHHIVRWTCYAALERERNTLTNLEKHGCPPKVASLTRGAVLRKANKRDKVTLEELHRSICYWGHGQHSEEVTLFRKNKQKKAFA